MPKVISSLSLLAKILENLMEVVWMYVGLFSCPVEVVLQGHSKLLRIDDFKGEYDGARSSQEMSGCLLSTRASVKIAHVGASISITAKVSSVKACTAHQANIQKSQFSKMKPSQRLHTEIHVGADRRLDVVYRVASTY